MLLSIDPGRDKVGVAIVDNKLNIYFKEILLTAKLELYLQELIHKYNVDKVILGDGTFSGQVERIIKNLTRLPVYIVDESFTTLAAEERYRKEHYKGFKKVLNLIKWKPSCPVDDYVAVVLAERYLNREN